MQKEQFERITLSIINIVDLKEKISKVLNSGCLDIDSIEEGDYTVCKALAYAILKDAANDLKPLSSKTISEAKNIEKFL